MSSFWDGVLSCTAVAATGTCARTALDLALAAVMLGLAVVASRRALAALTTLRARPGPGTPPSPRGLGAAAQLRRR